MRDARAGHSGRYRVRAPRSAIPKVVGILMIVFASLGLLGGLLGLAGAEAREAMFRGVPEFKTWHTISVLLNVVALGYGALHLYAGIRAIGYKANAVRLATVYAVTAIVVVTTNAVLVYAWIKPIIERSFRAADLAELTDMFGAMMMVSTLIGIAWPISVLVLMRRPAARAACSEN